MTHKVFIDGEAGTTGLLILDRLKDRQDISLIQLDNTERKDVSARKRAINESDVSILCLPDDAAIEAVAEVGNPTIVATLAVIAALSDAADAGEGARVVGARAAIGGAPRPRAALDPE